MKLKLNFSSLLLLLVTGCATAAYDHTVSLPSTNGVVMVEHTSGHIRSVISTSAMKGFVLGKETKASKSGLSIQEANTDPNVEFMKAMGDMLSGAVGAAAAGAAKGIKP